MATDLSALASSTDWRDAHTKLIQAIAQKQLSIIVPTMNAESFIDITLSYYRDIEVPVTVVVDAKSRDDTQIIARSLATKVDVLENSSSVVEGMIERLSRLADSAWVLRLDDDELPSLGMLAYVANIIEQDQAHVVGFVRKQCAVSNAGTLKASLLHSESDHRQWRLYRPERMRYTEDVHTAGFEPVAQHSVAAAPAAFMIHLDWSLHDYQSRMAKVKRYDAHTAGKGSMWRHFYLYEDDPAHGPDQFGTVDAPEFATVCKQIVQRMPQNCINEPEKSSPAKPWWRRWIGK